MTEGPAEVSVEAHARLHFGLIDLASASLRAYGGAGMAIEDPRLVVTLHRSKRMVVTFDGVAADTQRAVRAAIGRAAHAGIATSWAIHIKSAIREHSGLGSTTATVLAVLTALNEGGRRMPFAHILEISHRGRTSGVGCRTFQSGGFVIDVGQPVHPVGSKYVPSIDVGARRPSLSIGTWQLPRDWLVTLVCACDGIRWSIAEERALFAAYRGQREDALEQFAALYHGMLPGLLEGNLQSFARALQQFQMVGFKAHEIHSQSEGTRLILNRAWTSGLAAGMSSLGPTIFVIHKPSDDPMSALAGVADFHVSPPSGLRHEGATIRTGGDT